MIKWGGTIFRLHPLFVLMMAAAVMIGHFVELLVLFGVVVIHELGHVVAARLLGWRVLEVQLLPFGGVAVMEAADGADSLQEMVVALAGPLQNLLMIGLAFFFRQTGWWTEAWTAYFVQVNATIALFNLLPAEPLDGGRLLSAWIMRRTAVWPALAAGSWIGMIMSAGMAVYALLQLPAAGLKANLFVIIGFLAFHNGMMWRNRHFRFFRFLIRRQREHDLLLDRQRPVRMLTARESFRRSAVCKRFMRERYQLIAVLDERGKLKRIHSEKELLDDMLQMHGDTGTNMLE